jgi:hypothetical protein
MLHNWIVKQVIMLDRNTNNYRASLWKTALIVLLVTSPAALAAGTNAETQIWDTMSPFGDKVDISDRTNWKLVPANLLTLELNPSAAVSDPAYSGREYSFEGEAVVENGHLIAVFWSQSGRVVVYSNADLSRKPIEVVPLELKTGPARITRCGILQNTGNQVALEVSFSTGRGGDCSAIVSFDKTEIIDLKPAGSMKGVRLVSPIEYGVIPSFVGDDLVFDPEQYASTDTLCIPSENVFLGLLEGENSVLVATWPDGKQQMKLKLDSGPNGSRLVRSVDFDNDGKSLYLALLGAPGIWHKEELKPTYLEKDVAIDWKKPFPAKWTTQLIEAGVKTTFTFRESKDKIWRGVIGHYTYPVWFNGDTAFYRLSKKIPPRGKSLVYFVEGKDTPASVSTSVDIMKQTLGRQASQAILDLPGRKLRTHHRRGSAGVRRACTCGGTEAIQVVFEAGEEVARREYVEGIVDDTVYFVVRHIERINEYRDFANNMIEFLVAAKRSAADLKPFLDGMEAIVQEIPAEYSRQRENMKTLAYTDELARKTKALTRKKGLKNLPTYLELGKKWREMGGAQDSVIARFHSITRKLSQEAGYGCVYQSKAVEIAEQIRKRCWKCLRNADGYEIWPDY